MIKVNTATVLLIVSMCGLAACEKKNEDTSQPTTTKTSESITEANGSNSSLVPGKAGRALLTDNFESFIPNPDLNKTLAGRIYSESSPLQWEGVSFGLSCREPGKKADFPRGKENSGTAMVSSGSKDSEIQTLEGGEKGGTLYLSDNPLKKDGSFWDSDRQKKIAGRIIDELLIAANGKQKYFEVRFQIPANRDCAFKVSLPAKARLQIHSENYAYSLPDNPAAKSCRGMQMKNEDKYILLECDCPFEAITYMKFGWSRNSSAGKNCFSKHALVEDNNQKF